MALGTVISLPFSGILAAAVGWESVFYVQGGLALIWCVLWLFFVYDSPEDHPRIHPAELELFEKAMGTHEDNGDHSTESSSAAEPMNVPEVIQAPAIKESSPDEEKKPKYVVRHHGHHWHHFPHWHGFHGWHGWHAGHKHHEHPKLHIEHLKKHGKPHKHIHHGHKKAHAGGHGHAVIFNILRTLFRTEIDGNVFFFLSMLILSQPNLEFTCTVEAIVDVWPILGDRRRSHLQQLWMVYAFGRTSDLHESHSAIQHQ